MLLFVKSEEESHYCKWSKGHNLLRGLQFTW